MTSITFHGGVNEIGGNKILVEDGDTRILLDFGMSFGRLGKYYEEYVKPRTAACIGDFLEMGLLPDIKGIYRSDHLKAIGRKPEELGVDAAFISHAHADHVNYVTFLHEKMPIYCGATAKGIIEAVTESSGRKVDYEILNFKERPILDKRAPPVERDIRTFRTGDKIKVGSIEVIPIHVDHSVPGAYGFVIHTSGGTIVYTGDMRLHGTHAEMTTDFINRAAEEDVDALISEGTRIDRTEKSSEQEVYAKCKDEIAKTNRLVFADFNFKDVDRLRTFVRLAKETGRKFVIGYKEACLLKRYAEDGRLNVPALDDESIVIYQARKGSGTFDECDYKVCERQYYSLGNAWQYDEVLEKQDDLIMFMNFWNLGHLIDIKPKAGSLFIHSLSEAFNEEMAISEERENNWLEHFRLKKVQAHCSGHASGPEIKEAIEKIGAKRLFPIHTEHPEMFKGLKGVEAVKEGQKYEV